MSHAQVDQLTPILAAQMWGWAMGVFAPAILLKKLGMYYPLTLGSPPAPRPLPPRGPDLCRQTDGPVLLDEIPAGAGEVEGFDACSSGYDEATRPFIQPIWEELLCLMRPHLHQGARVLDPSCGPGRTAMELAAELVDGELVAADLSRGMVEHAHAQATGRGLRNMAFFQADVVNPPERFHGYFDAVCSCLSFHHYPDAPGAAAAFRRVLAPGGKAFIADAGPQWYIDLARPISTLADPGFVRHRTGPEFQALMLGAGFREFYWEEALPGIGFMIAST